MAKSLADAWRPQIGCHGLIFDGIGKMIFLADQDLGKDSDVQTTITARALEAGTVHFQEILFPRFI